jgi:hypothetical protein
VIAAKAYAEVYTTSTHPPTPKLHTRDYYNGINTQSPLDIFVTKRDTFEVDYKTDTRLRIVHMTESDAGFGTLDTGWNGFAEGLGMYNLHTRSDIVRAR